MSDHIFKSHNKTLLLYHLVFPLKYRRKAISNEVGVSLKNICLNISYRYEIEFVEIGYEQDYVHFMVQSVPTYSATKIVRVLKSITARELFQHHPEVKKMLWDGKFWASGYYSNTVGQYSNEEVIKAYVKNQGMEKDYKKVHKQQLKLF